MKSNPLKYNLLVPLFNTVKINTEDHIIYNSTEKELLGLEFEKEITFFDSAFQSYYDLFQVN